ncbi:MAG TPA: hypothetical protein VGR81_09445 [Candidatus Acidoferrales bacterium]|nr:hypothetical protein [Candidatus Acidoferrales bacterium]
MVQIAGEGRERFGVVRAGANAGDLAGAKAAYLVALHRGPADAAQWSYYGSMLMNMHDDADARAALEKGVAIDAKNTEALNNLAWFYATSFHKKFRNPAKALRFSLRSNDLSAWQNASYIDTYAAALDLAGKHDDAAIVEQEAVYLAPKRTDFQETLKKYELELSQSKHSPKSAPAERNQAN